MGYRGWVADKDIPESSLGKRLKAARKNRRMSQQELADGAGVSIFLVRKIEQDQRDSARLENLAKLATALSIPMSEILGVQPGLSGEQAADVSAVRSAIYSRAADVEPPSLAELRTQLADLRALYWHARFAVLAHQIPGHLTACRSAVRAATGDEQRREANGLLAETLQIAASLVAHLAYEDLAHVALLQGVTAAEAAEDRLLLAAQHSATAWVLSRQGLWQQAQQLAATAAAEIEPVLSQAPAEQIGLWGELLHFGLVALAREDRVDEAHELLGLVQAAGHALGARPPSAPYAVPFNRTFAGHSAVQLAQTTDQPREALRVAERVEDLESLPPSIHARYLLNVAWASTLEWRSEEALSTLRKVEQVAPEMLQHSGLARSIVEELMPRRRTHRLPGLVGIAERMQISAP